MPPESFQRSFIGALAWRESLLRSSWRCAGNQPRAGSSSALGSRPRMALRPTRRGIRQRQHARDPTAPRERTGCDRALGPEISQLERHLDSRALHVARAHYRQAVDSFVDGRLEASNGQLRSFLEDFLMTLCERAIGTRPTDARSAADRLRNHGDLDGDEAKLIAGLAGVSNERGGHAGLTDRDEGIFRLHATTAVASYLLARTA